MGIGLEMLSSTFYVLIIVGLYFLPSILAGIWKKKQLNPILILNFLGGWTGIGWLVALVWACMEEENKETNGKDPLTVLKHKFASEEITEKEYLKKKEILSKEG